MFTWWLWLETKQNYGITPSREIIVFRPMFTILCLHNYSCPWKTIKVFHPLNSSTKHESKATFNIRKLFQNQEVLWVICIAILYALSVGLGIFEIPCHKKVSSTWKFSRVNRNYMYWVTNIGQIKKRLKGKWNTKAFIKTAKWRLQTSLKVFHKRERHTVRECRFNQYVDNKKKPQVGQAMTYNSFLQR